MDGLNLYTQEGSPSPVRVGRSRRVLAGVVLFLCAVAGAVLAPLPTPVIHHPQPAGNVWAVVATPNPGTVSNTLSGVACVTTSDCWAVGYQCSVNPCGTGTINVTNDLTLTEHWNGTTWSTTASPNVASAENELQAVECTATTDCWAVGSSTTNAGGQVIMAMHWDGVAWTLNTPANPSQYRSWFGAVAATSGSNVWAVGCASGKVSGIIECKPLAEVWNGTGWTSPTVGNPNVCGGELRSIAVAPGTTTLYAAGNPECSGPSIAPWVEQCITKCSNAYSAAVNTSYGGVGATSGSDVNVYGGATGWSHYNGTTWSDAGTAAPISVAAFTEISPTNMWVAGWASTGGATAVWNGTSWSQPATPAGQYSGIAAVTASDIWAVGQSSGGGTLAIHYAPGPPSVTSVAPTSGPVGGGTSVTVNGGGFTGATSVSFGGTAGTGLTVVSDSQLTVTAPAHASGVVDVTVTTPTGTSATSAADHYAFSLGTASTTTLATSNATVVTGQSVTYTAAVTPTAPMPTGTVIFKDNGTVITGCGAVAVDGTGHAACATAPRTVGSHSITAVYSGDANYASSTSVTLTETVNIASTTTTLAVSPASTVFGQPVTMTATVAPVAPAGGLPASGDSVTFYDGATALKTASLNASGQATFTDISLTVGSHTTLTAVFAGDTNYATSTSANGSETVTQASSTTAVTSSVNPSIVAQAVTYTATVNPVAPSVATPAGQVTFFDGGVAIAGCSNLSLDANGQAACAPAGYVSPGTHSITATYSATASFATSTSPTMTQSVLAWGLVKSPNQTTTANEQLNGVACPTATLCWAVGRYSAGTYNQNLIEQWNGTAWSIVASPDAGAGKTNELDGITCPNATTCWAVGFSATGGGGAIQSLIEEWTGGSWTIVASTNTGSDDWLTGVSCASTSMCWAVGYGQFKSGSTTLRQLIAEEWTGAAWQATVVPPNPPTAVNNTSPLNLNAVSCPTTTYCSAVGAWTDGTVNTYTLGEQWNGTAWSVVSTPSNNFCGAQCPNALYSVTCLSATSCYALGEGGNYSAYALGWNGTAWATASISGTLVNGVTCYSATECVAVGFNYNWYSGTTLGDVTAAWDLRGASWAADTIPSTEVNMTAGGGNCTTNCLTSVACASATVCWAVGYYQGTVTNTLTELLTTSATSPGGASVTVSAAPTPVNLGQTVTFTATVTGSPTPTGTVTFVGSDGTTFSGCANVAVNGSGVATCIWTSTKAGSQTVAADYSGDATYNPTASTYASFYVNPAPSTTSLTSNANPSVFGQSVTFTATVAPSAATGTVTFYDGATSLGTGTLSAGVATYSTAALAVGTHSITAQYAGDSSYAASTSAAVSQVVNKASSTSTITSSLNPSLSGQNVTYTATIAAVAPGAGTPGGSGAVAFKDGAAVIAGCGAVTPASGTAACVTTYTTVGSHSITAVYAGDTNFTTSTSATLTQTVNQTTTTTSITSSVNPAALGQSTTYTATVVDNGVGTWSAQTSGVTQQLNGLACVTTLQCWAVGNANGSAGTIVTTANGGTTWTTQAFATTQALVDIDCTTSSNCWAVGNGGVIIATTNGGTTWTAQTSGTTQNLQAIDCTSSTCFVVGTNGTILVTTNGGTTWTAQTSGVTSQLDDISCWGVSICWAVGQGGAILATTNGGTTWAPQTSGTTNWLTGIACVSTSHCWVTGNTGTIVVTTNGGTTWSAETSGVTDWLYKATCTTASTCWAVGLSTGVADNTINGGTTWTPQTTAAGAQLRDVACQVGSSTTCWAVGVSGAILVFTQSSPTTSTVTFQDNAVNIAACTNLAMTGGVATCTQSYTVAGPQTIKAIYNGDVNYATSSATLTETINQAATTTTVTSSVNPSAAGQSVTFLATVVGLPLATANQAWGQTTFTAGSANQGGSPSATTLSWNHASAVDTAGNVYEADTTNNRVLYYPVGSTTATIVYGQPNMLTVTANTGGLGPGTLSTPKGVVLDSGGNLYISDSGNNRVLYFASGSTTPTRVYGQGGLYTTAATGLGATGLNQPSDVAIDPAGGVYIADFGNNRVLHFTGTSTTADRVYGQSGSFATGTANIGGSVTANGLNGPTGLTADGVGGVYVSDTFNNRVLNFSSGSTTASRVYGQLGSFATSGANQGGSVTANTLSEPHGVTVDTTGNVYISDKLNNRILYFPGTSTTATHAYGQGDVMTSATANNGGISAYSLFNPYRVTIGPDRALYVDDSGNNRLLRFPFVVATGTVTFNDGATALATSPLNASAQATYTTAALAVGTHPITAVYNADTNFTTSTSTILNQVVNAPTVTRVYPPRGPVTGGQYVTVVGTFFTGAPTVKFGTVAATTVTVNSGTRITAVVPAGSAGTLDVTVTQSGVTSATSAADQYTYTAGGVPMVWGDNVDGELGNGGTCTPSPCGSSTPASVSGVGTVIQVAGSTYDSYALRSDGTVWAWGAGTSGQIGNGGTTAALTPAEVCAPGTTSGCATFLTNIVAISASGTEVLALRNDGTVWAWGTDANGALGVGTTAVQKVPAEVCATGQVSPCASPLANVVAIAAGIHVSAFLTADGSVWTAGDNFDGELGVGTTCGTNPCTGALAPVQVCAAGQTSPCSAWLGNIVEVGAGNQFVAALGADGTVSTWGRNDNGQLGQGSTCGTAGCSGATVPLVIGGFANTVALAAVENHATAIKSDGTLWGWGGNGNSELGNGTAVDQPAPVEACAVGQSAGCGVFLGGIVAIAPGSYHTITLASAGTLDSVGHNTFGELGTGNTSNTAIAVATTPFAAIALGGGANHSLAIGIAPVVTAVSPTGGPGGGGTAVTVTGSGFTGATAVKFGLTSGTAITVVSDTQITVTAPSGSGVVDITVTTPVGTSATSAADHYTYSGTWSIAVATSGSPSTYDTTVTFTATVTFSGTIPTPGAGESVTFYDGATALGTGLLNASGVATLTTTLPGLAVGTHTISATYSGDATYPVSGGSGAAAEYAVPTAASQPYGIAAGPDGNLWYTEYATNKVAKATPTGTSTEYAVPTASAQPFGIVTGPDGNLWFTEFAAGKIGMITTSGVITEYSPPTAASQPTFIVSGPGGNLWFTEFASGKIGLVSTGGAFIEYTIPTAASNPDDLALGADGNIWFTEQATNKIGKVTPTGTFTEYTIPTATSKPDGIVAGGDGNLWFVESNTNKIGVVTTAGVFTEYAIPTASSGAYLIARGPAPDTSLWFTEQTGNKVGRVTLTGSFTEYTVPTAASTPNGIVTGPDGRVWFTEKGAGNIAAVTSGYGAVTQVVNAGTLTVVAPAGLSYPSLTPGTTTPITNMGSLSFTDTLGDGSGWTVKLAATDLYNSGTSTIAVPFTAMTFTVDQSPTGGANASGTLTSGSTPQTLTGTDTPVGTTFSNQILLASGTASTVGTWTMAANKITMIVNATATAGTYTSTIQYTITG